MTPITRPAHPNRSSGAPHFVARWPCRLAAGAIACWRTLARPARCRAACYSPDEAVRATADLSAFFQDGRRRRRSYRSLLARRVTCPTRCAIVKYALTNGAMRSPIEVRNARIVLRLECRRRVSLRGLRDDAGSSSLSLVRAYANSVAFRRVPNGGRPTPDDGG